jgi:putative spermidine/putrescine transport system ATP-binding protein
MAMTGIEEAGAGVGNAAAGTNGIDVEGVEVRFANGYYGLRSTSLSIEPGTFCTLLGPSGSGKTTLLRAIAGLINPTAGKILFGRADVTRLPVQARNIGFVFQNYALFPHMTVAENIGYPLKLHNWAQADRLARVSEILDLIELPHVAGRSVGDLSGGQQQRVAIGRALAYRPSVLLLDEPMGALDRRLRQQLGRELRDLQRRTGITTVYVTHDQEEAFILSDAVAIMDHGEILQYDSPFELYFKPRSEFVARFLGEANIIEVDALGSAAGGVPVARTRMGDIPLPADALVSNKGGALSLVLRPEDLVLSETGNQGDDYVPPIRVRVTNELFLGSRCLVTVADPAGQILLVECGKSTIPPMAETWLTWKMNSAVLIER